MDLGLTLSTNNPMINKGFDLNNTLKRSFDNIDDEASSKSTLELPVSVPKQRKLLHLFVWNTNNKEEEMEEGNSSSSKVVGWPPIKSWNKKLINTPNYKHYDQEYQQGGCVINVEDEDDNHHRKMFVKVSMEGMPIGRKIDLSVYDSYQSLTTAILNMFGKYYEQSVKEGDNRGDNYTLTYLDKEGDWLLVGDVPWKSFIGSVQRLKITKKISF